MPWDTDEIEVELADRCPICLSEMIVPPTGDRKSLILVVGDAPGEEELEKGRAFIGPTGRVLKTELLRKGVRLHDFRIMNLWQHAVNDNPECFDLGVKEVIKESKGKKLIVLVGADTVKYFTGEKVSDWNGLMCHSAFLGDVFVMNQPATAFHGGLGEVRFAIERLATLVKEILDA